MELWESGLPGPLPELYQSDEIGSLLRRAERYLQSGLAVNLSGPSGTGKTLLALHLAARLKRPVLFVQGDDGFTSREILGEFSGYQRNIIMDNYIRSVVKRKEVVTKKWTDHWLTKACQNGYTLIYDEFTRSHPEANNVLLPVLEERVLMANGSSNGLQQISVHPEFRLIFTSNPVEYAGVYATSDALWDRFITFHLSEYDHATEVGIVQQRTGLRASDADLVVKVVRAVRKDAQEALPVSLRPALMIGRIMQRSNIAVNSSAFREICLDVLGSRQEAIRAKSEAVIAELLPERGHKLDHSRR